MLPLLHSIAWDLRLTVLMLWLILLSNNLRCLVRAESCGLELLLNRILFLQTKPPLKEVFLEKVELLILFQEARFWILWNLLLANLLNPSNHTPLPIYERLRILRLVPLGLQFELLDQFLCFLLQLLLFHETILDIRGRYPFFRLLFEDLCIALGKQ